MLTTTLTMNVLIAEDDETNQFIARKLMKQYGWSHTIVQNGKEAIEASQNEKFDLILMDINMPEMGGMEAVCHLRAGEGKWCKLTPIVAITDGNLRPVEAKANGFTALMRKPLTEKHMEFLEKLYVQSTE